MMDLLFQENRNSINKRGHRNQSRQKSQLMPSQLPVHLQRRAKFDSPIDKMPIISFLPLCKLYKIYSVLSSHSNSNSNSNNNDDIYDNRKTVTININNSAISGRNCILTAKKYGRCKNCSFSCNRLSMIFALLLILMAESLTAINAFQLDGSQSSFAQFRKWYVGLNGSLELEFKTEQPNGLVLYTDDGGTYDFFELKLVEGALRLRYNLGGGAQIITVGRDLHDGHWHKVQVSLYNKN